MVEWGFLDFIGRFNLESRESWRSQLRLLDTPLFTEPIALWKGNRAKRGRLNETIVRQSCRRVGGHRPAEFPHGRKA
jgi:hypothetical protein